MKAYREEMVRQQAQTGLLQLIDDLHLDAMIWDRSLTYAEIVAIVSKEASRMTEISDAIKEFKNAKNTSSDNC